MTEYLSIVYHHGGVLKRNGDGVLTYVNGKVDMPGKVDVDHVNLIDIEKMFMEFGYETCKRMLWQKPGVTNLDLGLTMLVTDADVLLMCESALQNGNEIHVFFDDCISVPEIVSEENTGEDEKMLESHSDSYDSVEDEMYRPSPERDHTDTEDECDDEAEYEKEDEDLMKDGEKNDGKKKSDKKKGEKKTSVKKGKTILVDELESSDRDMSFEEMGYGYESEQLRTPPSSEDEGHVRPILPKFNEGSEFGHVHLELGMEFDSLNQFKMAVKDYNIALGRQFIWVKNDRVRARAKCSTEGCDWLIFCAWNKTLSSFQFKTFNEKHSCCRVFQNKKATRDWVAKKLEKRLLTQPSMRRSEAFAVLKEEYNVHVKLRKVTKALQKAKDSIEGTEKEQYGKVREYLAELIRSNPGSTCVMQVIPQPEPEPQPLFDRLYICLDACKKGFLSGCRPLIGLDGCFLKGYYGGQLLSVVGEDANKQFYVIAYVVVDSETKENWKWFLTLLQEDLGDHSVYGWNFISDQQKGLVPALKEVMPRAHHRFCVQHVWKNFIKNWKDKSVRGIVWEAARCTTVPEFQKVMNKLRALNESACRYLENIDPSCWVKAYYSHWPKCDNITNNMAEVWNSKIVNYRSKPIITLCEELRSYIMRRMAAHKRKIGTMKGELAPAQQKRLDQFKVASNLWTPTWTGNLSQEMYEVSRHGKRVGVNLTTQTCACNVWQLTGLPCEHAVAAIAHKNEPAENYVHQWLTLDALKTTYEHTLNPVNSDQYWPATDGPKLAPPHVKRPIGRPKKQRKKDPTEGAGNSGVKVKRSYVAICSKCGGAGHYAKSCKGPAVPSRSKRKPVNVTINSRTQEEIPLSQGGPMSDVDHPAAPVQHTTANPSDVRDSPPPSNPMASNEVLTDETINAASRGIASRFYMFMPTPGFRPPRPAPKK